MFEANDGPIFVKYVLNAFAISCSSVNILLSTLNRHGFCFFATFLFMSFLITFHVFFSSFLYLLNLCS